AASARLAERQRGCGLGHRRSITLRHRSTTATFARRRRSRASTPLCAQGSGRESELGARSLGDRDRRRGDIIERRLAFAKKCEQTLQRLPARRLLALLTPSALSASCVELASHWTPLFSRARPFPPQRCLRDREAAHRLLANVLP